MADTDNPDNPAESADNQTTPATGDLDQRVDGLEAKVDKILGILGGKQSDSEQPDTPQQPGNIADEIRQQLDERDRKAASAAEETARTDRLSALEVKVTELAEKPPESMPRRIEKIMGWR